MVDKNSRGSATRKGACVLPRAAAGRMGSSTEAGFCLSCHTPRIYPSFSSTARPPFYQAEKRQLAPQGQESIIKEIKPSNERAFNSPERALEKSPLIGKGFRSAKKWSYWVNFCTKWHNTRKGNVPVEEEGQELLRRQRREDRGRISECRDLIRHASRVRMPASVSAPSLTHDV